MPYAGDGPRLHYERTGSGEPMLFITGFTISAAVFDPVLPLYTDRFDCVTYDNRGSGRSAAPLKPTSMPELAWDAVRVLDACGIESAHVYGLSMGGMIAQEMAIRYPERVRGLVLGCTSPGGPRAVRPTMAELTALGAGAMAGLREPGRPVLARMLFSPDFRRREPERVRSLLTHFAAHRAPAHGMAGHWWASIYHDTVARLPKIQAPTLVMHGGADVMAPIANARLLAERIPDAELAVVEGTGHAYLLERPERSRDLLLQWLDARDPIGPGRPNGGIGARMEPVTRALGLPIGALRTGRSLIGLGSDRLRGPSRGPGRPSG
ncbi:MAG TPA: alpha/beta hydrolase [Solirubrobacteraceae bacterium]|jgi:pimeloyl-ACP methyl ester carboxylesterase